MFTSILPAHAVILLLQTMNVLLISVANIIKRYKVHGAVATFPGHGRKNKCNFRLNREIARKVEKRKKLLVVFSEK